MQHQYFLEDGCGERMSITFDEYNIRCNDGNHQQLVATKFMTVIRPKNAVKNMQPPQRLRYGGRVNHRNPNGWRGC